MTKKETRSLLSKFVTYNGLVFNLLINRKSYIFIKLKFQMINSISVIYVKLKISANCLIPLTAALKCSKLVTAETLRAIDCYTPVNKISETPTYHPPVKVATKGRMLKCKGRMLKCHLQCSMAIYFGNLAFPPTTIMLEFYNITNEIFLEAEEALDEPCPKVTS
ncbi:hypothetical protein LXL04_003700 [Taraxacum kok-saghyz]